MPVVLYVFEVWFLTYREEYGLRDFETGVLRKKFWPKGQKVTGGWRSMHTEEVCGIPLEKNLITVQQDATYSVYYISAGSSTCFGC